MGIARVMSTLLSLSMTTCSKTIWRISQALGATGLQVEVMPTTLFPESLEELGN